MIPVKGNKTNDSTAKIGMNFAYIAINVRNFNSKAKIPTGSIQEIEYFTFSYIHGS
jgi:hypothetical protein